MSGDLFFPDIGCHDAQWPDPLIYQGLQNNDIVSLILYFLGGIIL